MIRKTMLAALAGLLLAGASAQGQSLIKKAVTGKPALKSIDAIRFGPQGVLIIADGRGSQIIAVDTGDTKPIPSLKAPVAKLREKLAGRIGAPAKGISIVDMAVNPASQRIYFAVRAGNKPLVLTMDGSGKVGELALDNVKYARLALPKGEKSAISKITDLAWAEDRVLAAAQANEQFGCKLYSIPVPLVHDADGAIYSAETYHVSHRRWETKAPMSTLMPFKDKGKMYVVGAFACTPVVKYPIDNLTSGAKVKGQSVIELGSGNRPLRMFAYEKDNKAYILMNTNRFHHKRRPFGPSPYWTVRIEYGLLGENEKIDKAAQRRLDGKYKPITDRMKMVNEYHGVMLMDKLDGKHAVVVKEDYTLAPLALP